MQLKTKQAQETKSGNEQHILKFSGGHTRPGHERAPRKENGKPGKMNWKIDLNDSKLEVKSVELLVQSKCFETGKIVWKLVGDSKTLLPRPGA